MTGRRLAVLALLVLIGAGRPSAGQTAREYAVKASFMAKFISFVRWPEQQQGGTDSTGPFVVALLGEDPFGNELREAFRNADLKGRTVRIRVVDHVEDLAGSRMVFLSKSSGDKVPEAVRWARAHGALTVGDGEGFAQRGVAINFVLRDDKVRFEINPKAAERSGIQISSLLLKVSRLVEEP